MRKRLISETDLQTVIQHRQMGRSWLRIEQETGVPRRSAKKAYDTWIGSQAFDELKEARKLVAAELLRLHFDRLLNLASTIAENIPGRLPSLTDKGADALVEGFCDKQFEAATRQEGEIKESTEKRQKRMVRQSKLFLESLREHLRAEPGWQALEKWRRCWNDSIGEQIKILFEGGECIRQLLDANDGHLRERVEGSYNVDTFVEEAYQGICTCVRHAAEAGNPEDAGDRIRVTRISGLPHIVFGDKNREQALRFHDPDIAEDVRHVLAQVAREIGSGNIGTSLVEINRKMLGQAEIVEKMFDRERLRPVLLRTRCSICPA